MQHFISVCGLSLAWVTSENSTSNSNADILSRSSSPWLDPLLSPTVSGVRCWLPLSVVPRQLSLFAVPPLCCPVANCLSAHLSSQLSFASPYHFRIRRDFRSKNPLSGFAPKQTKESSVWRATHIVLHNHPLLPLSFIHNELQHNSTTIRHKESPLIRRENIITIKQQAKKQKHLQEVTTEITKF